PDRRLRIDLLRCRSEVTLEVKPPFAGRIVLHDSRSDLALAFPVLVKFHPSEVGDQDPRVLDQNILFDRERVIAAVPLESLVPGLLSRLHATEERSVGPIETLQRGAKDDGGQFPVAFGVVTPDLGEALHLIEATRRFPELIVAVPSLLKGRVVQDPT